MYGSLVIPNGTSMGITYNIASINIDTAFLDEFCIKLDFTCNIVTVNSKLKLGFQIFRQGNSQLVPMPLNSDVIFHRETGSFETNTFSFIIWDRDSQKNKYSNFSVSVKILSAVTTGTTIITNANLMAAIVENPNGRY